jgi:hypothetical protein
LPTHITSTRLCVQPPSINSSKHLCPTLPENYHNLVIRQVEKLCEVFIQISQVYTYIAVIQISHYTDQSSVRNFFLETQPECYMVSYASIVQISSSNNSTFCFTA